MNIEFARKLPYKGLPNIGNVIYIRYNTRKDFDNRDEKRLSTLCRQYGFEYNVDYLEMTITISKPI